MKRIYSIFLILFFYTSLFCQSKVIKINSNSFIKYDFILEDSSVLRSDMEFYNKLLVEDGIFKKPIEIAYIGYHEPLDNNPIAAVCYNTELGNIIVILKQNDELWSIQKYRRILIHEMIHAYQFQVLNDDTLEHNDNFKKITKEINLKYHYNIQNQ